MHHLTLRLIARRSDIDAIMIAMLGVEGVQRIKLVDDLLPQMGEESPATIARSADFHPTLCSIDVEVSDAAQISALRQAADAVAAERGIRPEFIEEP
jgi:hypothetical protein